jgi:alpha/beta superfamily hydrolase
VARRIESHSIAGPAGRLEALLEEPDEGAARFAALVCHPHPLFGGTMHNKVVFRMARGLRAEGAAVLRFNFRGVGASQGEHGNLEGEIEDARSALAWLRERYPGMPFGLAGFSFGAMVVSRLGCSIELARWVLAAGFPTRRGGAAYLEHCGVPKIFVQSTHDQYGPRAEMEAVFARVAEPKRIVWVEALDHFFAGGLDQFEEAVRGVPEASGASRFGDI